MKIKIVFDGPPSPDMPRFVEVEDDNGYSINAGEWKKRDDGLYELVIGVDEHLRGPDSWEYLPID